MKFVDKIQSCKLCPELANTRNKVVLGEGPIPCSLVFLGEAPGRREDETGLPFQGVSGDLLRALAHRCGLKKGDYHILNVLKCRPPENRDPTLEELENCKSFLQYQIRKVNPNVIVALGRYGQSYILKIPPQKIFVSQNAGKIVEIKNSKRKALLTFHPAYVQRNRGTHVETAFLDHLRKAKNLNRSLSDVL